RLSPYGDIYEELFAIRGGEDRNLTEIREILASTGVVLADDAITSGKYDESTAFPLVAADSASTQIARVGADSDTLETLSDQLDTVLTRANFVDLQTKAVTTRDATDETNPTQYTMGTSGNQETVNVAYTEDYKADTETVA
ncbi:unnamed protein product, partial [marine sediment metagenome]